MYSIGRGACRAGALQVGTRKSTGRRMRFKKSFTDPVPESRQTGYDKAGIEVRLNRPLAIRAAGLKADDLREMIYAYPTNASDIVHLLN